MPRGVRLAKRASASRAARKIAFCRGRCSPLLKCKEPVRFSTHRRINSGNMKQITDLTCAVYELLIAGASSLKSPFLLFVRLYWGWQMLVSGRAHLSDVPAMVERFQEWGVPFPTFNVYLSGLTECVCGLLLIVGFASRLITIPLIVNFCVAYLTASREVLLNVFNDPDAFVSDPAFLFLLASVIVFISGPGAFSVDALLEKLFVAPRKNETEAINSPLREDYHGKLRGWA
jgi:putative oxidoreductase